MNKTDHVFVADYSGDPFTDRLPGLVGELTDYFYNTANRPCQSIALTGALAFMAGLTGKAFNVSETGLNLYFLILAPSGWGKEAISSGINRLVHNIAPVFPAIQRYVGGAELVFKGDKMAKQLTRSSSFVALVGEAGIHFKQMVRAGGKGFLELARRHMLDLFHKSGRLDTYREVTPPVQSPAVSIVGETIPELWWATMTETAVRSGLHSRFIVIDHEGDRPAINHNPVIDPPPELVNAVTGLARICTSLIDNDRHGHPVKFEPEALALLRSFNDAIDREISERKQHLVGAAWNRAYVKTLRLAALVAVGVDSASPMITVDIANWAIAFTLKEIGHVLEKCVPNEMINREAKQVAAARKAIREYRERTWKQILPYVHTEKCKELWEDGVMPRNYITKRLGAKGEFQRDPSGTRVALDRVFRILCEAGEVTEIKHDHMLARYSIAPNSYRINHLPPEE